MTHLSHSVGVVLTVVWHWTEWSALATVAARLIEVLRQIRLGKPNPYIAF